MDQEFFTTAFEGQPVSRIADTAAFCLIAATNEANPECLRRIMEFMVERIAALGASEIIVTLNALNRARVANLSEAIAPPQFEKDASCRA
jgi:uncharacterized PurR-regulated membrane protein YhhQ (DUF165 family)